MGFSRFSASVTFLLAACLFFRYLRSERALFTGACLWLVYVPILQYGGQHYFYWPGAFNGLADAAFAVCLWRWLGEVWRGANWSPPVVVQRYMERRRQALAPVGDADQK